MWKEMTWGDGACDSIHMTITQDAQEAFKFSSKKLATRPYIVYLAECMNELVFCLC